MIAPRTHMHRLQELVRMHRQGTSTRDAARLLKMGRNTALRYRTALSKAGLLDGVQDELPLAMARCRTSPCIAVNANPGDDVAIALDYRTGARTPRVVASDWWSSTEPTTAPWREISKSFVEFARLLTLLP